MSTFTKFLMYGLPSPVEDRKQGFPWRFACRIACNGDVAHTQVAAQLDEKRTKPFTVTNAKKDKIVKFRRIARNVQTSLDADLGDLQDSEEFAQCVLGHLAVSVTAGFL